MDLEELIQLIIDNFDVEQVIEELDDYLAELEEIWDEDNDLDYEVDEEGFYCLT